MSTRPYRIMQLIWLGYFMLLWVGIVRFADAELPQVFYVSTTGKDSWSGRIPQVNANRTDGPFATLAGAHNAIRNLRLSLQWKSQPITVLIRGGVYRMSAPFVLTPEDSGSADTSIIYSAYPDERPVFSGGRVIRGWQRGQGNLWMARVPEVTEGKGCFQQIFVNGQRRVRARTPNAHYFFSVRKGPQDRASFVYRPGDIQSWQDLNDINVVVYHAWETARHRIKEVDEANRSVYFTGPSRWHFEYFGKNRRYYVENAPEFLDPPGEWYLDRNSGVLSYYPMPGEDMRTAQVIAPVLRRLVEFRGEPELGLYVEHVTLQGLSFQHQDWALEPEGHSDGQAVVSIPAAVMADGARDVTIQDCEIAHIGEYGVWFRRGCKNNRIVRNRIHDLGAGGVRIGEAGMAREDHLESSHNIVDNNHIFNGGHVYAGGVGVWVAQSSYNVISHNEIHDFNYTGISVGWNWGDDPNRCHHNLIEYNHVHHVMNRALNDGGAIYTLGTSPGSVIRNNVFHDVWPYDAIGWGIYLDATTNGYLVENNIVFNTLSGGLMKHNGGHENIIQNNIFAFSAEQALWPCWEQRPNVFRRNIVYLTQGDLFIPMAEMRLKQRKAAHEALGEWDYNLYFNPHQAEIRFFQHSFSEWQQLGLDLHSLIADPEFVNPLSYDFRLKPTSPALKLGFKPIDVSKVGLYGSSAWVNEAKQVRHAPTVLPSARIQKPFTVNDGFEETAAGEQPEGAYVSGEEGGASIRVTDEQAATGMHSLKFTDAPGLPHDWQPHMFYQPHFVEGKARQSFDIRLERGSLMYTEWRDVTAYPDCIGPSLAFDGSGRVTASGKPLTTVPVERWVHVEVECVLGRKASGTYTVTITPPGETARQFENLVWSGKDFRELHWLGFVGTATATAVFCADNIRIEMVKE